MEAITKNHSKTNKEIYKTFCQNLLLYLPLQKHPINFANSQLVARLTLLTLDLLLE